MNLLNLIKTFIFVVNSYCSCSNVQGEATPCVSEKWPFKRGGLSSEVEKNMFMFRFTLSSGLSRRGGLSKGPPLYCVR